MKHFPGIKLLVVGLVGFMVACALATAWWLNSMHKPLSLEQAAIVDVEQGASLRRVANRLAADGILAWPDGFVLWARLQGDADSIRAGEYRITPEMSPADLLALLVSGRSIQHPLTLVEGMSYRQILEQLWQNPVVQNTLESRNEEEILALLDSPFPGLEGILYPETYFVTRGTSDLAVIRRAHDRMQAVLAELWPQRQVGLPWETPWEALIMASIVEKESGHRPEKRSVAGVFARRLQVGMRLQSDPTVIYGVGSDYDGVIRRVDLDTHTAYNTYRINGLPPTPIALPGRQSLVATLQPAMDEPYLYFVSRGDGSHYFSETLQEHNAAVRYYIRGEGEPPAGHQPSTDNH